MEPGLLDQQGYPGSGLRCTDIFKVCFVVQATLVLSKSKGPSETLRDIRTLTYQMCSIEENINRWMDV